MLKLDFSYNLDVESAYIITVRGNPVSESMSHRAQESCQRVGMPNKIWDAFDGTRGDIVIPHHLRDKKYINWFKQMDPQLSKSEVACVLSHVSLWCHCIEIERPIVVLEHDAVMIKPFTNHLVYNTIIYLGCHEQYNRTFPVSATPLHGSESNNYHFILRLHAYSIDPCIAKTLVSHVISHGIHESADHIVRADLFPILQTDLYAYDLPDLSKTTITDRKKTPQGTDR